MWQIKKITKTILSVIGHILGVTAVCAFLIVAIILSLGNVSADEMLFKFKNPSFSGNATSSHYLTIENQQFNRDKAIKEEIQAYKEELARDSNNTTLARFIRNLESRIYAELSRQLVDNMFGETKSESGSFTLEGNQVDYSTDGDKVTLTINESDGGKNTISVPIGSFTF
jgi:myosin heavy subunit